MPTCSPSSKRRTNASSVPANNPRITNSISWRPADESPLGILGVYTADSLWYNIYKTKRRTAGATPHGQILRPKATPLTPWILWYMAPSRGSCREAEGVAFYRSATRQRDLPFGRTYDASRRSAPSGGARASAASGEGLPIGHAGTASLHPPPTHIPIIQKNKSVPQKNIYYLLSIIHYLLSNPIPPIPPKGVDPRCDK